jgi:competence ComEA-like helix-hairpin-helix protein
MIILLLLVLLGRQAPAPMVPVPSHETAQQPPSPAAQPPVPFTFEMREMNEAEAAVLVPGEGREAVAFMCVPCHGVLPAVAQRRTALGWSFMVEDMRVKGARGSDEQAQAAAKYLSEHFAAVNVNTATAEELVKIAELSAEDAAAIIAFRGDGHPFKSYTDVKKVPGVDSKRLAAAKPRLAYTPK